MSAFTAIVWNNRGERAVHPTGGSMEEALKVAKTFRTLSNRTVKIGCEGGTVAHWIRSEHLPRNHWSRLPVADDLDSCHDAYIARCRAEDP